MRGQPFSTPWEDVPHPPFWDDPRRACKDKPEAWFFPDMEAKGVGAALRRLGVATCNSCPLRARCRDWAMSQPRIVGIWGATSTNQRDKARKRNAQVAA